MSFEQGGVVWSDDPFKDDPDAGRPWLVIANDTQPFREEQSMAIALSTSGYEQAVPIEPSNWTEGDFLERATPSRGPFTHPTIGTLIGGSDVSRSAWFVR